MDPVAEGGDGSSVTRVTGGAGHVGHRRCSGFAGGGEVRVSSKGRRFGVVLRSQMSLAVPSSISYPV